MESKHPLPVIWTPRASAEYLSAVRYIAEERPAIAIEQGDLVRQAAGRLADYPRLGRPGRRRGTRELVVPGTPFIVGIFAQTDKSDYSSSPAAVPGAGVR
ncbi:type II toxin-antitoxin system RelE/ParE family toxin [Acidithiobacillus ferrivorans]|uniref:type II toxin-antitoxin system RelE/ParE family toxin n=1 Tax=Acidithiobacillus ferrivorans TaxID=160808 RepID=UPI000B3B7D7C